MEASGDNFNGSTIASSGYGVTSAVSRTGAANASSSTASSTLDVDRKAEEDLAAMSSDRRQIVEALAEERAA
jgi:hypothetical protein